MIQRVQTLFLIVAIGLLSLLLFLPLATFDANGVIDQLKADSLTNIAPGNDSSHVMWPLFITTLVMLITPLVTIFFYNKRLLQMRLTVFSAVLSALYYALYFYTCHSIAKALEASVDYKVLPLIIPVCAIALFIAAFRKIGHDEMLIRSLNSNRIR